MSESCVFCFRQKTAYEWRISDWSSDVCSSDLRVEVLKGPQGTLFGQNSTAGAINYIANKPTDTFSAGVSGSFGRFDWWDARGFVSGPISDTLSIRIAAAHEGGDGWQKGYTREETNGDWVRRAGRRPVAGENAEARGGHLPE